MHLEAIRRPASDSDFISRCASSRDTAGIEVETEPSRGSRFTVYLPVMSDEEAQQFEHGSGIDDEYEKYEKLKAEEIG